MSELLPEIQTMMCKYRFSETEKQEIGAEMAQAVNEKQGLEDDLKAIKDDYKARISRAEASVNSCAAKLNNGYEMRQMECGVIRDYDKKTITWERVDNGEIIKSRKMTSDELQMELAMA